MSGTQATSQIPATSRGRGLHVTLWVLQVLLAFQFAMAGLAKVLGDPAMVEMFATIGQWFRYVVGVLMARLSGFPAHSPEGYPQDPPYSWWRLHDEYDSAIGEERS